MPNPFDQFDAPARANPFDQFDEGTATAVAVASAPGEFLTRGQTPQGFLSAEHVRQLSEPREAPAFDLLANQRAELADMEARRNSPEERAKDEMVARWSTIANPVSPLDVARARSVVGTAFEFLTRDPNAEPTGQTFTEALGERDVSPTGFDKAAAGVQQVGARLTSPETMAFVAATAGLGALPVAAQRATSLGFAGWMAANAGTQAAELEQAVKDDDVEAAARATAGLGLDSLFAGLSAKHGLQGIAARNPRLAGWLSKRFVQEVPPEQVRGVLDRAAAGTATAGELDVAGLLRSAGLADAAGAGGVALRGQVPRVGPAFQDWLGVPNGRGSVEVRVGRPVNPVDRLLLEDAAQSPRPRTSDPIIPPSPPETVPSASQPSTPRLSTSPALRGEAAMETRPTAEMGLDRTQPSTLNPELSTDLADTIAALRAGYRPEAPVLRSLDEAYRLKDELRAVMGARPGPDSVAKVKAQAQSLPAGLRDEVMGDVEHWETSNAQRPTSKPPTPAATGETAVTPDDIALAKKIYGETTTQVSKRSTEQLKALEKKMRETPSQSWEFVDDSQHLYNLVADALEARGELGKSATGATGQKMPWEMVRGDRFKDANGVEFEVWRNRQGTIEAHPVVSGKPVVNKDSGVRFSVTDEAKARNPENRTDLKPTPATPPTPAASAPPATKAGAAAYAKVMAWLNAESKAGRPIGRAANALQNARKMRLDPTIENDLLGLLRNADVEDNPLSFEGKRFDDWWDEFNNAADAVVPVKPPIVAAKPTGAPISTLPDNPPPSWTGDERKAYVRAVRAIAYIKANAPGQIRRVTQAGKHKLEVSSIALRDAAEKIGITLPRRGTFFNPESDLAAAETFERELSSLISDAPVEPKPASTAAPAVAAAKESTAQAAPARELPQVSDDVTWKTGAGDMARATVQRISKLPNDAEPMADVDWFGVKRVPVSQLQIVKKSSRRVAEEQRLTAANVPTAAKVTPAQASAAANPKFDFNPKVAKEQKKFLLDAVDKALAEAPDVLPEEIMRQWQASEHFAAKQKMEDYSKANPHPDLPQRHNFGYTDAELAKYEAAKQAWEVEQAEWQQRRDAELSVVAEPYMKEMIGGADISAALTAGTEAAFYRSLPHVTIEVPGDGVFSIVNTKDAIRDFKERAAKFPTTAARAKAPGSPRVNPTPVPALGEPTKENVLKAASLAVSTDTSRAVIMNVWSDGKQTVATDGRRMLIFDKGLGGTEKKPVMLDAKGKPAVVDREYPNWKQVRPAEADLTKIFSGQDAAKLWTVLKQADAILDKEAGISKSVKLWWNPDRTLGISSSSADVGAYEHNVQPNAKLVTALKPEFLMDALDAARKTGSEKVDVLWVDELSPVVIRGDHVDAIIMPMRLTGPGPTLFEPTMLNKYDLAKTPAEARSMMEKDLMALEDLRKPDGSDALKADWLREQLGDGKPKNMAGEVRPEKVKAKPVADFASLHQTAQDKFNVAWRVRSVEGMQELVHAANPGLRAEWERRTGTKLPKGVAATDKAVADYFARTSEGSSSASASPMTAGSPMVGSPPPPGGSSGLASVGDFRAPVPAQPASKPQAAADAGFAESGLFVDGVEVRLGGSEAVNPVLLPEMFRLFHELTGGEVPFLRRYRAANGMFYGQGGGRIGLHPDLFKFPHQVAYTFAHELGHLVDYLPDRAMDRGNVLGRIGALRNWLTTTFPLHPKTSLDEVLKPNDRAKLRREAEKAIGPKPSDKTDAAAWQEQVSERYGEMVEQEIEARGLISLKQVRDELLAVSQWWRPYDPATATESYRAYRESGVELYADALSVLFNSPGHLEQKAPTFYKAFWNWLDAKPEFKAALARVQELLGKGDAEVLRARVADDRADFAKGRETFEAAHAEQERLWSDPKEVLRRLERQLLDKGAELERLAKAERGGGVLPVGPDLREKWEQMNMADNLIYQFSARFVRDVVKPLQDAGLDANTDLGIYLKHARIQGNKSAREELDVLKARLGRPVYLLAEKFADLMEELERKGLAETMMIDKVILPAESAGIEFEDITELARLRIEQGTRADLANPRMVQAKESERTLNQYLSDLGPAKAAVLKQAVQAFHDEVFKLVEHGHRAGIFSDRQLALAAVNKDTYAAFRPLEYVDTYVQPTMRKAKGSAKPIENPFVTTMLKMQSLADLIMRQESLNTTRDTMQRLDPEAFKLAETFWTPNGKQARSAPRDRVRLVVREQGKPVAYDVDPAIAEAYQKLSPYEQNVAARWVNWLFHQSLYKAYVSWSLPFNLWNNPWRDVSRTQLNMAAVFGKRAPSVPELARAYKDAWDSAKKYTQGELTPLSQEALDFYAIYAPTDAFYAQFPEDNASHAIMVKLGLAPEPPNRLRTLAGKIPVVKQAVAFGDFIMHEGQKREAVGKLGPWLALQRAGVNPEQAAAFVRNYVGTPNIKSAGSQSYIPNAIFPFYRIYSQAARTWVRLARNPQTRGGYFYQWAITRGTLRALLGLAGLGAFGTAAKQWIDGVPEYERTRGIPLPLPPGSQPGGDYGSKSVFLRIPDDEFSALLGYSLDNAIRAAAGQKEPGKAASDAAKQWLTSAPGLNTYADLASQWMAYAGGGEPRDNFRGRPVLSEAERKAGGTAALGKMAQFTADKSGIPFMRQNPTEPTSTPEAVLRFVPLLKDIVKVTDAGFREKDQAQRDAVEKVKYAIRMDYGDNTKFLLHRHAQLDRAGTTRTLPQEADYRYLQAWHSTYNRFDAAAVDAQQRGEKGAAKERIAALERLSASTKTALDTGHAARDAAATGGRNLPWSPRLTNAVPVRR